MPFDTTTRTTHCPHCGYRHTERLTDEEAFWAYESDIDHNAGPAYRRCPQCSAADAVAGYIFHKPDRDTLERWILDPKLTFIPSHREDIILSLDEDNIPLLLAFIDREDALPAKRDTLAAALCLIAYDLARLEPPPPQLPGLLAAPRQRLPLVLRAHVWDHNREVVWLLPGLTGDTAT